MWGLTFKANTDDLRESPALQVIDRLRKRGAIVRAFDPAIHKSVNNIVLADSAYHATEDADVVVLLTEWDEFKWLDFQKVAELMATPRLFDTRNIVDGPAVTKLGFEFKGLGRS